MKLVLGARLVDIVSSTNIAHYIHAVGALTHVSMFCNTLRTRIKPRTEILTGDIHIQPSGMQVFLSLEHENQVIRQWHPEES